MTFLKATFTAALFGSLTLTAPAAFAQNKATIGIAMPTKSSARWIA
jgi:putative multiple sugar transport system substrate-binding protein